MRIKCFIVPTAWISTGVFVCAAAALLPGWAEGGAPQRPAPDVQKVQPPKPLPRAEKLRLAAIAVKKATGKVTPLTSWNNPLLLSIANGNVPNRGYLRFYSSDRVDFKDGVVGFNNPYADFYAFFEVTQPGLYVIDLALGSYKGSTGTATFSVNYGSWTYESSKQGSADVAFTDGHLVFAMDIDFTKTNYFAVRCAKPWAAFGCEIAKVN